MDTKKDSGNGAKLKRQKEGEVLTPSYYAHFRVSLPEDTDSLEEMSVRDSIVKAVMEAVENRSQVFEGITMDYRFELTTDWKKVF